MRIRNVKLKSCGAGLLLLAFCGTANTQDEQRVPRGELGVRYWLSTGETKLSHNAQGVNPGFGNPTSILVYDNLDANALELFGRVLIARDWFVKGFIGAGKINRGALDDEDFFAGQVKFSDTTSSVDGALGYGAIDIGHQWVLKQGAVNLGVFAGFSQWTETYDAIGTTVTVGPFPAADHGTTVISNKARWRALRVGLAGQFALGRARLALDLAAAPYAELYNEDSHHLRGDLGPVPNVIDTGEGWGVQADAELRYAIAKRTELGLGLRYWYFELRDGTSDFRNVPGGETPIVDFYTRRAGLTLSLLRTW
jgi:hypothetical protein